MGAGTVTTGANPEAFYNLLKDETRARKLPNALPCGVYAFDSGSTTVADTYTETAGDEFFPIRFPTKRKCYIVALQVTFSDLDSGANLIVDTIVEDTAGTETVLITGTNPQAAVNDEMDINAGNLLREVTGQYLGFKVTTGAAGGAVAGTVRYKGLVYLGDPVSV